MVDVPWYGGLFLKHNPNLFAEQGHFPLTPERVLAEMDSAGVNYGLILPNESTQIGIDIPSEFVLEFCQGQERLLPWVDVSPQNVSAPSKRVEKFVKAGGEINRLSWDEVDLNERSLVLYTRKKKGGDLTPRKIPMTEHLFKILSRRYVQKDKRMPWVFWHSYTSRATGETCRGPYGRRKRLLQGLCKKAEVQYFNFHALRHSGASVMDNSGVPLGSIQRILGHENRSTTEKYLQSIGDSERQAISVFEEVSRNSHTDSHTDVMRRIGQDG